MEVSSGFTVTSVIDVKAWKKYYKFMLRMEWNQLEWRLCWGSSTYFSTPFVMGIRNKVHLTVNVCLSRASLCYIVSPTMNQSISKDLQDNYDGHRFHINLSQAHTSHETWIGEWKTEKETTIATTLDIFTHRPISEPFHTFNFIVLYMKVDGIYWVRKVKEVVHI